MQRDVEYCAPLRSMSLNGRHRTPRPGYRLEIAMNLFRKLLALLLVLGVAAYALPASAQNNVKRAYALVMSPGTLNAGQAGQAMNAAVQNVSPDGISTIRSFKLAVTGAGIKITGATVGSPF